jgi:hypothetical protein
LSPDALTRIQNLDLDWARQLEGFLERQIAQTLASLQQKDHQDNQVEYVLLAGYWMDLAGLSYALGEPFERVRSMLREASKAYRMVFRLRHTQKRISASPMGTRVESETISVDDSLTNSRTALKAMKLCALTESTEAIQELASLVGDPNGASYVGIDSSICTPNDQHLAKAIKALVKKDHPRMALELDGLSKASNSITLEAQLLKFLTGSKAKPFLDAVKTQIAVFEKDQGLEINHKRPESFLNVSALAFLRMALDSGVISRDELLEADLQLPLELLFG